MRSRLFFQEAIPFWDSGDVMNVCVPVCVCVCVVSYQLDTMRPRTLPPPHTTHQTPPTRQPHPPLARIWIWILSRFMADDNFPLITVNSSIARSEVARLVIPRFCHRLRLGQHTHTHTHAHSVIWCWIFWLPTHTHTCEHMPVSFISLCIHLPS